MRPEEIEKGKTYRGGKIGRLRTVTTVRPGFNNKIIVRYTSPHGYYPFYQCTLDVFARWAFAEVATPTDSTTEPEVK